MEAGLKRTRTCRINRSLSKRFTLRKQFNFHISLCLYFIVDTKVLFHNDLTINNTGELTS